MKKIIITIVLAFLVKGIYAQQWAGSSNLSGDINRIGSVAIGSTNTSYGRLTIKQTSSNNHFSGIRLMNSATQSSFFWMDTSNKMRFDNGSNATGSIIFNGNGSGDVGIGLTGTNARLSIKQKSSDNNLSGIQLKNGNNQSSFFWMDTNNKMHFDNATNASRDFVFNGSGIGNVGIGSNNPDEKLTVKGTVHCQEVKVDLSVPADYVFQKYYNGVSTLKADYTMPTLEEVAVFTKANHHLPSMPSAKEIQENGLHLKEMTNLLLQKIEELTLYTIEQEKRINALEAKLAN